MRSATKKQSKSTPSLSTEKVKALFVLGNQMADLAEDILEERGEYSDEFKASLERAEADRKAGRVIRLNSLDELITR